MKVDRGEFNPARTRVLHYVMNPESEAHNELQKSKIQELEAENSVLKSKLSQQGEAASSEPQSQLPTPAVVEAELLVLRQKVIYDLLAPQKQRCGFYQTYLRCLTSSSVMAWLVVGSTIIGICRFQISHGLASAGVDCSWNRRFQISARGKLV